jgi:4'-phosphopantetheinyl transferase
MFVTSIEIWHGALAAEAASETDFLWLLSPDEVRHAQSLNNPAVRHRRIEVRARLRTLLAMKLNCDAAGVKIATGTHGKPYLPDFPDLAFNLSHSGNYLAIAIARECAIGIDIEQVKARKNLPGLAERCFSPAEIEHWQQLPKTEQISGFFRLWTAKEAFVKATGQGIQLGMDRCVIDTKSWRGFSVLPEEYEPFDDWHLRGFDLAEEIVGTLVVHSPKSPGSPTLAITPYPLELMEDLD